MTLDLETQIRRVADVAFDQTEPVQHPGGRVELDRMSDDDGSRRRRSSWIALVAASVLAVVALSAVALTRRADDSEEPGSVDTLDFAQGFSVRAMLAEIPLAGVDPAANTFVAGTDLARLAGLAGVERTAASDPLTDPTAWVDLAFSDRTVAIANSTLFSASVTAPGEFREELGFDFLDVDRYITAWVDVLDGADSSERSYSLDVFALGAGVDELAAAAGDDRVIDVGDGDDGEINPESVSAVRPIGRPLRVGVDPTGPVVAATRSTPFVNEWLTPDRASLADVADLLEAATQLDAVDELYSAQVASFSRDASDVEFDRIEGVSASDIVIDEAFTTVGIGWSGVGETRSTTIVYVFADDGAAARSVEPIERVLAPDAPLATTAADVTTVGQRFMLDAVSTVGRSVIVTGRTPADVNAADVAQLFSRSGPISAHR
ncbi:MAG: hypothetical protein HKN41_05390 [Ilumatobacter sp.]|nr:hypothetical protein [Ilumatobacter sp.]